MPKNLPKIKYVGESKKATTYEIRSTSSFKELETTEDCPLSEGWYFLKKNGFFEGPFDDMNEALQAMDFETQEVSHPTSGKTLRSLQGVPEEIILSQEFIITKTKGGSFRCSAIFNRQQIDRGAVCQTFEEAKKAIGIVAQVWGLGQENPEALSEFLRSIFEKAPAKERINMMEKLVEELAKKNA